MQGVATLLRTTSDFLQHWKVSGRYRLAALIVVNSVLGQALTGRSDTIAAPQHFYQRQPNV